MIVFELIVGVIFVSVFVYRDFERELSRRPCRRTSVPEVDSAESAVRTRTTGRGSATYLQNQQGVMIQIVADKHQTVL
jgi:hypothetical protein